VNSYIHTFLNITGKFKQSYAFKEASATSCPEMYNHLLIAQIKDTSMMFSFIVQVSIIEPM